MTGFSAKDIQKFLGQLNDELVCDDVHGEVYLVGGAVMCLVFQARASTKDIDAFFQPAAKIRRAASRVAAKFNLSEDWLNDSVKGYLSQKGSYVPFFELSHLKIMVADPKYLLAMKCLAMRIGEEFYDEDDIRFLLRYLNICTYKKARAVIEEYYPIDQFPQKTLYALEEILKK